MCFDLISYFEKDQATLFTYFAPRCICIAYPWFYIFLQSKSPKMEKHIPINDAMSAYVGSLKKENMTGKTSR